MNTVIFRGTHQHLRENARQKLALSNAMLLHDISRQKLADYLRQEKMDDLWAVLHQSESEAEHPQSLAQLVRRPLFFGIMIAVAEELRQGSQPQQGETWEQLLWRLYLNDCLAPTRPARNKAKELYAGRYTQEQSQHWLHCLAMWMQTENKVELRIEEIQPSMLKHSWPFGLIYILAYALFFGLTGWLFKGPIRNAATGMLIGLEVGLFYWLYFMRIAFNAKLSRYLLVVMPLSVLSVLVFTIVKTKNQELGQILAVMLAVGLFAALFDGLLKILKPVSSQGSKSIHLKELLCDVLRSSLLLFPVLTFISMMIFTIVMLLAKKIGFDVDHFFEVNGFYLVLLGTAASSFFVLKTNAVLQHYLLRLCLRLEGQLPLRLVPWLEAMHQRKILQQVGGSYHFLHKQLQEYLASGQIG